MKRAVLVLIIGIVVLVLGGALTLYGIDRLEYPNEAAVWEGDFPDSGGSEIVRLDQGHYEIWAVDDGMEPTVDIKDSSGNHVYNTMAYSSTETISGTDNEYIKLGEFDTRSADSYSLEASRGVIFITPETNYFAAFGSVCGGVVAVIMGIIMMIAAIIIFFTDKRKTAPSGAQLSPPPMTYGQTSQTPYQPPPPTPYEPPPPSPYEPPPPPPPY